jgi:hypothetical protein
MQGIDAAPDLFDGVGSRENNHFEAQWPGCSHALSTLRGAGRPTPRKTRFRLLARLYRVGLITHRVPVESFEVFVTSRPPSPGFAWRNKTSFENQRLPSCRTKSLGQVMEP